MHDEQSIWSLPPVVRQTKHSAAGGGISQLKKRPLAKLPSGASGHHSRRLIERVGFFIPFGGDFESARPGYRVGALLSPGAQDFRLGTAPSGAVDSIPVLSLRHIYGTH